MKFPLTLNSRVTYINKNTQEHICKNNYENGNCKICGTWQKWKIYKDCSEEERKKFNLASWPSSYILFDKDLETEDEKLILNDYQKFKEQLKNFNINNFMSWRSRAGYHVLAKFKDLSKLKLNTRKEITKYYINLLDCDISKTSNFGVVAVDGRPHFKNGEIYNILNYSNKENIINKGVIEAAEKMSQKNEEELVKINKDRDFKNFFTKDSFFNYLKNNQIPDNTNRDLTIFPNLAIAASKTGKTKSEIKDIIKPIIDKNFPGKTYQEFDGWLKKAFNKEITDYNPFQINTWMKENSKEKKDIYDLTPITTDDLDELKKTIENTNNKKSKFNFYWDKNLDDIQNRNTEWLIEKWIPKGDICFVAGKAASFKSTISLHLSYAISEGKLFFNKYSTKKSKVLYLNEENSSNILLSMVDRVKKGLDLEKNKSNNIAFTILENIKLDSNDDLNWLINFIRKNDIKVLICDSFRRFIRFDENSATEMNGLFDRLKLLRNMCKDLTVIILHHLKKENTNGALDVRDMLRGSSDIVNSADSIIGIKRKHGCNAFQIEHIKNRSGEEMSNKLVLIDTGENSDKAYFYESDKEMDKEKLTTGPENKAELIIKYLKENNITRFKKENLSELEIPSRTLMRAFKLLISEGTITPIGETRNREYIFNDIETIQQNLD